MVLPEQIQRQGTVASYRQAAVSFPKHQKLVPENGRRRVDSKEMHSLLAAGEEGK
jgi:hypothetical protein